MDGKTVVLPRFDFEATLTAIIKAKEKKGDDKIGQVVVEKKEEYLRYIAKLINGFPRAPKQKRQNT